MFKSLKWSQMYTQITRIDIFQKNGQFWHKLVLCSISIFETKFLRTSSDHNKLNRLDKAICFFSFNLIYYLQSLNISTYHARNLQELHDKITTQCYKEKNLPAIPVQRFYKLHVLDTTRARNQECKRPNTSAMKSQFKQNRRRLDGTIIMYREATLQLTAITDDVGKKEKKG